MPSKFTRTRNFLFSVGAKQQKILKVLKRHNKNMKKYKVLPKEGKDQIYPVVQKV